MKTFVLVHGAWHAGELLQDVAHCLRNEGLEVHTPTLAGNRPGDSKETGLQEAIESLVTYLQENKLTDVVLVGHSYGGMVITAAADQLPTGIIRRLVYWSAYVPHHDESLVEITPPAFGEMFQQIVEPDGGVPLPYEVFREALINDASEETARHFHARLVTQPHKTLTDKIALTRTPAEMTIAKSYLVCRDDVVYPASQGGWHPRFSERLGLFRYISMPGGHEVCLTAPEVSAHYLIRAGRD